MPPEVKNGTLQQSERKIADALERLRASFRPQELATHAQAARALLALAEAAASQPAALLHNKKLRRVHKLPLLQLACWCANPH